MGHRELTEQPHEEVEQIAAAAIAAAEAKAGEFGRTVREGFVLLRLDDDQATTAVMGVNDEGETPGPADLFAALLYRAKVLAEMAGKTLVVGDREDYQLKTRRRRPR